MKDKIREILMRCGACAVGFAKAEPVEPQIFSRFREWLLRGDHAEMRYMENHEALRQDPRLLLPDARSIIVAAFPYGPSPAHGISAYACYPDYHDTLRKLLQAALAEFPSDANYRICIDSAPILERYWAWKSGIGIIGLNGALIVPGVGNRVFLTEIITTLPLEADTPLSEGCGNCGACMRACPTGALTPEGINCNRCLSYLTIEHRGEWTEQEHLAAMCTEAGRSTLFGCDRCMEACPWNVSDETGVGEQLESVVTLTKEDILNMSEKEFSRRFKGTSLKRAKYAGLVRNALL